MVSAFPMLLLDGAQATELEKDERVDLGASTLWSAALLLDQHAALASDVVVDMHRRYVLAGADVVTTISYQASLLGFRDEGHAHSEQEMERFYERSVALAVQGRDAAWKELAGDADKPSRRKPLIAASIGCYGAALADGSEYRGDYGLSKQELIAWHRHRFAFFATHAAVDFLLCETIPCLVEVDALLALAREHPSVRLMLAVACRDGASLNNGDAIAGLSALLKRVEDPSQVLAVGVNCTAPQHVESLLQALDTPPETPKLAYPNSGEHWDGVNKRWLSLSLSAAHAQDQDHDQPAGASWAAYVPAWWSAGARVFGGCCRTSPDDIAAIAASCREQLRLSES
ncbi:hypothetical protein P43SY_004176 [Pythium insidiosum]|uniref:Hcy-binding domain-containing protein n=1 Tax=Pythium insidiosum TaxID=114742 RepID=A0AAD5LUZ0_PYTIN|nr:hypothetical protein P43SY_004176 [Pythium insidiosum]